MWALLHLKLDGLCVQWLKVKKKKKKKKCPALFLSSLPLFFIPQPHGAIRLSRLNLNAVALRELSTHGENMHAHTRQEFSRLWTTGHKRHMSPPLVQITGSVLLGVAIQWERKGTAEGKRGSRKEGGSLR